MHVANGIATPILPVTLSSRSPNPTSGDVSRSHSPETGKVWHVSRTHALASDENPGTEARPLRTINAAAQLAQPGDTVLIDGGVYRERISPARGGTAEAPITYTAMPGAMVSIRGSEVFAPDWRHWGPSTAVVRGELTGLPLGTEAYAGCCDPAICEGFNPYHRHFNREVTARPQHQVVAELASRLAQLRQALESAVTDAQKRQAQERLEACQSEYEEHSRLTHRRHRLTMGQVFVDGRPLRETEWIEELRDVPGTWMVDPDGGALLVHPPVSARNLAEHLVEVSVRHTVFAPLTRGLGHITLRGLIFEHAANHFPTWGKGAWAQAGMVSCRSGHHWVIEHNVIRHAKSLGLDCGSEGGAHEHKEFPDSLPEEMDHAALRDLARRVGYHVIRHNHIHDNGHCGMAGIGHYGTRVLHNVIERNNCDGWTSPWWEFAGIKFHFFFDGVIEGNLIRDNEAHGIWIDNQWRGSRITRNVIVNNLWSGINVELGRGPVMIDHNIVALTRRGDGIYGHDCADITVAHNLIYGNANCGAWFAYATPRVKPEHGCWDIRVVNNIIMGNQGGAVGLPMPWTCGGRNVTEGNLYMGGGEYLDEGSGPRPPLFILTNQTHMGQMQAFHSFPVMTEERTREMLLERLRGAGVPESLWPNPAAFTPHAMVPLELWRTLVGPDSGSAVMNPIREGLCTTRLAFQCHFPQSLETVRCQPVPGMDVDFDGQPVPGQAPRPGPFQDLTPGYTHRLLWPMRPTDGAATESDVLL